MPTLLKVKNNSASELASGITSGALSLTLLTGGAADFPSTFPFHITIEDEILSVTAAVGDTFTVTRAQQSTTAAAHSAGANVELRVTAKSITDLHTALNTLEDAAVLLAGR